MKSSSNEPSPVAEAMTWVSRVLAVVAMMVLPGLAGQWLDKRWGTGFLGLIGFAVGLVSGMGYLLAMTKLPPRGRSGDGSSDDGLSDDGVRGAKKD
ncbi:MAG TPA: AtpZ/AtpI family protein [Pirellulales bacterium]|nr:AtpZ/AtpI family protein [Pirellulales bacterium]